MSAIEAQQPQNNTTSTSKDNNEDNIGKGEHKYRHKPTHKSRNIAGKSTRRKSCNTPLTEDVSYKSLRRTVTSMKEEGSTIEDAINEIVTTLHKIKKDSIEPKQMFNIYKDIFEWSRKIEDKLKIADVISNHIGVTEYVFLYLLNYLNLNDPYYFEILECFLSKVKHKLTHISVEHIMLQVIGGNFESYRGKYEKARFDKSQEFKNRLFEIIQENNAKKSMKEQKTIEPQESIEMSHTDDESSVCEICYTNKPLTEKEASECFRGFPEYYPNSNSPSKFVGNYFKCNTKKCITKFCITCVMNPAVINCPRCRASIIDWPL